MKGSKKFALVALLVLGLFAVVLVADAGFIDQGNYDSKAIEPFYTHTYSIAAYLGFQGNNAICSGEVCPKNNDFASITVTLYKQNGSKWEYIDSWSGSATGGSAASASGSVIVSSGTYKVVANGNVGNKEFPSASTIKTKP